MLCLTLADSSDLIFKIDRAFDTLDFLSPIAVNYTFVRFWICFVDRVFTSCIYSFIRFMPCLMVFCQRRLSTLLLFSILAVFF